MLWYIFYALCRKVAQRYARETFTRAYKAPQKIRPAQEISIFTFTSTPMIDKKTKKNAIYEPFGGEIFL